MEEGLWDGSEVTGAFVGLGEGERVGSADKGVG